MPAAVLAMAYLAFLQMSLLPPGVQELAPFLPYVALGAGMGLSLFFNRSRAFFLLLMFLLAYWSYREFLQNGPFTVSSQLLFVSFCLVFPFNIALISFMREKSLFSSGGRKRLVFLALEVGLVVWAIQSGRIQFLQLSSPEIEPGRLLWSLSKAQAVFVLAGIAVVLARMLRRRGPMDVGLFGALLSVLIACNWLTTPHLPGLFIMAAVIILTLSVLQDSYNMAFRDDLTGLPSRRALNELLLGLSRPYVIAMVDVDHFKRFNDTYGHDVGDQVLKMVATKIAGVGGGGKAFRYGGEEFTVVFPRRRLGDVVFYLEELRKKIAEYKLCIRGSDRPKDTEEGKSRRTGRSGEQMVSVTVSIGVAESSSNMRTTAEVIKGADAALYKAKGSGRNQVSK